MPTTQFRRLLVAATCGAALVPVGLTVSAHADGGPTTPTTITFQEDRPKIALLHLRGSKGDAVRLGDKFVGSGGIFDTARKRLGTVTFDCTAMESSPKFFLAQHQCTVTYKTAGGQIVAAGLYKLDGSQPMPIVGGSGPYTGIRGTLSGGKPLKGFDSADVLTLQP